MVEIFHSNLEIIKKNFHYLEVDKITKESVCDMAKQIGITLFPENITLKSDKKAYKKYFVFNKEKKPVLFLKQVWEKTVIQELIALHFCKYIFDKELVPDNYLFGIHYPKAISKTPIPYILLPIVPGKPIEKGEWEKYSYQLGVQLKLHQIISLYDCDLRHFFASSENVYRIDFGLSFYHLDSRYRGFEEYMPKGLPYVRAFWKGYQIEEGKLKVILLNTRGELKRLLGEIEQFQKDDLVNFNGLEFVKNIKKYWEREKLSILEE